MPQEPRVLIVNPAAESAQSAGPVTITTYVERFTLVDPGTGGNSPGEGHLVYYMDADPPIVQGVSALTENGTYALSTDTTYTWEDVPPGQHVFWVQLVNDNDTPLEPPQAVRVYVTTR